MADGSHYLLLSEVPSDETHIGSRDGIRVLGLLAATAAKTSNSKASMKSDARAASLGTAAAAANLVMAFEF